MLFLALTACGQAEVPSEPLSDYLIFGMYFGMCYDDCATLIKIENGTAYADDVEFPFKNAGDKTRTYLYAPLDYIKFKQEPLPKPYYHAAKTLLDNFPEELAHLKGQEFGIPDGDDRGAIYLETRLAGVRKIWTIDNSEGADLPEVVLKFRQDMKDVYDAISEITDGEVTTSP